MKTVMMYEVWVGDTLKFASISEDEMNNFCEMWVGNGGENPDLEPPYEYTPVDHTQK